jgi:hypothetical protein
VASIGLDEHAIAPAAGPLYAHAHPAACLRRMATLLSHSRAEAAILARLSVALRDPTPRSGGKSARRVSGYSACSARGNGEGSRWSRTSTSAAPATRTTRTHGMRRVSPSPSLNSTSISANIVSRDLHVSRKPLPIEVMREKKRPSSVSPFCLPITGGALPMRTWRSCATAASQAARSKDRAAKRRLTAGMLMLRTACDLKGICRGSEMLRFRSPGKMNRQPTRSAYVRRCRSCFGRTALAEKLAPKLSLGQTAVDRRNPAGVDPPFLRKTRASVWLEP